MSFSMDWIRDEVLRADELVGEQEYDEAISILERAVAILRQGGFGHTSVMWRLAMAHDVAGYLEQAFRWIIQVRELEPASPEFNRSFEKIAERLRGAVREAWEEDLTPAYELLRRENAADVSCHLAMARWLLGTGSKGDAARLLAAVTTLHPAVPEAWALRAEAADALGDAELAGTCRLAEDAAGGPEPFPSPPHAKA